MNYIVKPLSWRLFIKLTNHYKEAAVIKIIWIAIFSMLVLGCSSTKKEPQAAEVTFDYELLKGHWLCEDQYKYKSTNITGYLVNGTDNNFILNGSIVARLPNEKKPFTYTLQMLGKRYAKEGKIYSDITFFNISAFDEHTKKLGNYFPKKIAKKVDDEENKMVDRILSLNANQYRIGNKNPRNYTVCNRQEKGDDYEKAIRSLKSGYVDSYNKKLPAEMAENMLLYRLSPDKEGLISQVRLTDEKYLKPNDSISDKEVTALRNTMLKVSCENDTSPGYILWAQNIPSIYEFYNTHDQLIASTTLHHSECGAIK